MIDAKTLQVLRRAVLTRLRGVPGVQAEDIEDVLAGAVEAFLTQPGLSAGAAATLAIRAFRKARREDVADLDVVRDGEADQGPRVERAAAPEPEAQRELRAQQISLVRLKQLYQDPRTPDGTAARIGVFLLHAGEPVLPSLPRHFYGATTSLAFKDLRRFHGKGQGGAGCPTCRKLARTVSGAFRVSPDDIGLIVDEYVQLLSAEHGAQKKEAP
jgi:hypothetical protein